MAAFQVFMYGRFWVFTEGLWGFRISLLPFRQQCITGGDRFNDSQRNRTTIYYREVSFYREERAPL